ncbi:serine/threonine-protein phosphatase [filamentous cyanobacterium LEGE 11480]|uniref:Serine/threonine-protein phosphatase n=1 Tax=Romeriopsis navalis LEGE 11480 TaxID=2777977 RepID=A0A928VT90_9CYAN|nr:protein phosphatase 2C domain-containing protein [Romeriopsis navalis]MBE9032621.1 serine/threonine-protein phosphatase [Romeriopsis navalis LEGE 11480]
MKKYFTGMTDPGMVRSTNQDAYYTDPDGRFFIVSDGMGGHAGGQEASRIAKDTIREYLELHWESDAPSPDLLEQAIYKANQSIIDNQLTSPALADMGTTTVVLVFREDTWCANVGDSRLYRQRGARLEQITEDQTWVAKAIKLGVLTADQARVHPMRHVLAQCLGREELAEIEILPVDIQSGDRMLLCSDGLTEELSDSVIENHVKSIRSCDMAASTLINAAKEHGGRDNITVVIVAMDQKDSD